MVAAGRMGQIRPALGVRGSVCRRHDIQVRRRSVRIVVRSRRSANPRPSASRSDYYNNVTLCSHSLTRRRSFRSTRDVVMTYLARLPVEITVFLVRFYLKKIRMHFVPLCRYYTILFVSKYRFWKSIF